MKKPKVPKKPTRTTLMVSRGYKPRKGFVLSCRFCEKLFYVSPCKKNSAFCSRRCSSDSQLKNTPLNCLVCGQGFYCSPSQQVLRNRETCSRECRGSLSSQRAAENRIKNGFTKHQIDRCLRYSHEAQQWRKAVFERDNYTCVWCGATSGNGKTVRLEADHMKPFAFFPDLRYEIKNGRTLCRPCHDKTKMSAKKMRELYAYA